MRPRLEGGVGEMTAVKNKKRIDVGGRARDNARGSDPSPLRVGPLSLIRAVSGCPSFPRKGHGRSRLHAAVRRAAPLREARCLRARIRGAMHVVRNLVRRPRTAAAALSFSALVAAIAVSSRLLTAQGAFTATGGFIEPAVSPASRALITAAEAAAFLPSRGVFRFRHPTTPRRPPHERVGLRRRKTACGRSATPYWSNINNHAGREHDADLPRPRLAERGGRRTDAVQLQQATPEKRATWVPCSRPPAPLAGRPAKAGISAEPGRPPSTSTAVRGSTATTCRPARSTTVFDVTHPLRRQSLPLADSLERRRSRALGHAARYRHLRHARLPCLPRRHAPVRLRSPRSATSTSARSTRAAAGS